jgi:hypothetical protein
MFIHKAGGIRDRILYAFAKRGDMTAKELHESVMRGGGACTLQAVYKELAGLEDEGIVLKVQQGYGLALPWVVSLLEFNDELSRSFHQGRFSSFQLPAIHERCSWRFSSIRRSDQFWMQVMLTLLQECAPRRMFQWLPHPWHLLFYGEGSSTFERALRYVGGRSYIIVGGETFLDRQAVATWSPEVFIHSFAPGPFERERTDYFSIVGDFVLTTSYQPRLVNEVDRYYQRITRYSQMKRSEVDELFSISSRIDVKLEHSPTKARRLMRKFSDYFGL